MTIPSKAAFVHETVFQFEGNIGRRKINELAENPQVKLVQTTSCTRGKVWARLNQHLFSRRSDIGLRIYGGFGQPVDLSILEDVPAVKRFSADCLQDVENFDFVASLPNLEELGVGIDSLTDFGFLEDVPAGLKSLTLGRTRSRKPSLAGIVRFEQLKELRLEGQSKGLESISELGQLENIVLRSVSMEHLGFLAPLRALRSLALRLGGMKSFSGIEEMESLRHLEVWQVRGVSQLDVLTGLKGLQELCLQSLPHVRAFPIMKESTSLRRIILENMKGLRDLSQLEFAPQLEDILFVDARRQDPNDLLPVLRNPSLQRVGAGFGSDRKNNRFKGLREECGKLPWDAAIGFQYH